MAEARRALKHRLAEAIEASHRRMLDRCFAAQGPEADEALAKKYARLIDELAALPREQLLGLRFLSGSQIGKNGVEEGFRPSTDDLLLFRRFAESAGYGFGVADIRGRISYVNPALCRMIGERAAEDARGHTFYEYFPESDRHLLLRKVVPTVLQEGQWTGELTLLSTSGRQTATLQSFFIISEGRSSAPSLGTLIIDISNRKRAEEAVRESEERFRTAFENSTVGIYRTTPDGRILLANPALVKMLGYSSFEEISGRNLEDNSYEPQYSRAQFKDRLVQTGRLSGLESAWLRRDGTILHVRESAQAVRDSQGEVLYFEGIAEDITDRKLAEEALRASEESFRALAENASDGIVIAVGDGKHAFANHRMAEISGYALEELPSMGFRELAAPEHVQMLAENFRLRLAGKTPPSEYETMLLRKDGVRVPVEVSGARTAWHGRVADIVLVRDITERKRAEAALRESEERYRKLIENISEFFYTVDLNGRITYASPTSTQMSGHEVAEVIGSDIFAYVHPDDCERARANVRATLAGGDVGSQDYRLRQKSGEYQWVRVSTRTIRENGVPVGISGVIVNIQPVKTAQHDLEEARAQFASMSDAMTDGVVIVRGERILFANDAFARMVGRLPGEVIGLSPRDMLFPGERERLKSIADRLSPGELLRFTNIRIQRKDGTEKRLAMVVQGIRMDGQDGLLCIAREDRFARPEEQA